MNAAAPVRILIVDDDATQMRALRDTLRDHGYDTAGCTAGEDALAVLREARFDLLLTDLMMPGMDGVALLTGALKIDAQLVGILMTGQGTIETAVQAMKAGAFDYVLKPIRLSALLPVLARAVGVRRLRLENVELRDTVAMHELNQAIAHTLDPNVLLAKIADAALAQCEADGASVMLLDEEGHGLYVAAACGEGREALLGERVPAGEGIAGWVAAHREPLVLDGAVTDPRFAPLHPRPGIQSALVLPMVTRNRLIGVLSVNYVQQRRSFSRGHVKILTIFTNAAAGIEAARLYDEQRRSDARYREVLHMAADGIVSIDDEQRIVVFNGSAQTLFGYAAEEVIGKPIDLLLPPDQVAAHRGHVQAFMRGPDQQRPMNSARRLFGRRKDGTLVAVEAGISKRSEGGTALGTAVVRDVTERLRQEERIARLTRLYAVLSAVNTTIVRTADEAELYADICRIATQIGEFMVAYVCSLDADAAELRVEAAAGLALEGNQLTRRLGRPERGGLLQQALEQRNTVWENDLLAARPDIGYVRREALAVGARAAAVLPFTTGGVLTAVMVLYADTPGAFGAEEIRLLKELAGDVSFALDNLAKSRRVDYLATHDQLTGLPNRLLFMDRLERAVAAARHGHRLLAVAVADVERFRQINDSFGPQAGDALLQQIGDRIRATLGEDPSLARVGADVFALIHSDFELDGQAELAKLVRDWMSKVMAEPFIIEGQPVIRSARAGIAYFPEDGTDAETLFHNAEAALKRAKSLHEPLVLYTPDLNARVADQLVLENKLRQAIERQEFVLHYQPKVDVQTHRIVGLEALIRWQEPETGLVPPGQFIPLLEETGLIVQVGDWAMREAARWAAALRARGLPVAIAVNVSPIQLRQPDFLRSVANAIDPAGGEPHGLEFEITEGVLMHDIETNVQMLRELRGMDVAIAIDDFGTGYSSLAYIALLPTSVIKIDRTFIMNMTKDENSKTIVSSIISLTHSLGQKVVAEGVETEAQLQMLKEMRCDQYQGYLFSKPVDGEAIERLLASQPAHP
ncbi:MAG: EAL domain-containing protein [Gammaproteobacteria bacterium]|nr:EAL domain-containing protein [Gammaproteobacteria bacterium]